MKYQWRWRDRIYLFQITTEGRGWFLWHYGTNGARLYRCKPLSLYWFDVGPREEAEAN